MGDAQRKPALHTTTQEPLQVIAERIGHTLRRLAEAASAHFGGDCYLHATLGRILLAENGFDDFRICSGYSAWRVGPGDGDVIAHVANAPSYTPLGSVGEGFAYHTWLESGYWLLDFTTYQLRHKAQGLDAADGGFTQVKWCPDFLMLRKGKIKSYAQVAQARSEGVAYYESQPELTAYIAEQSIPLEESDIELARLIFRNPEMTVLGLNTAPSSP